jgi:hypothetical protein
MEQLALSLCRISPRCSFVAGTAPVSDKTILRAKESKIQSSLSLYQEGPWPVSRQK